jgi:hypothetical protein
VIDLPSVFLAIPTMSNRVTIQIAAFMDALRLASLQPDTAFNYEYAIENGRAPVEYARNLLVGSFLRSSCDRMLFVDEDMIPESNVVRLVYSDADITVARIYKFDHADPVKGVQVGLGLCAMSKKPNGLYAPILADIGSPAIQECDAAGTACMMIRRRVLEDRRLWSDNVYTTADGKTIDGNEMPESGDFAPAVFRFRRSVNGCGIMGEDVDFCERAKRLGYSIKVDLNAVCGHFKEINIDEAGYLVHESLKRAVGGIKLEDGRIVKLDLSDAIKYTQRPPYDKMVRSEMGVVK